MLKSPVVIYIAALAWNIGSWLITIKEPSFMIPCALNGIFWILVCIYLRLGEPPCRK